MSDGGINDAARDNSTNLQRSLREQFAIEKAVADLKRPRSSTMLMCTVSPPNSIGRAEYYPVPFETNPLLDAL